MDDYSDRYFYTHLCMAAARLQSLQVLQVLQVCKSATKRSAIHFHCATGRPCHLLPTAPELRRRRYGFDKDYPIAPIAILLPRLEAVFGSRQCSARRSAGDPQSSRWMPPDGSLTIQHSTLWWGRLLCTLPQLSALGSLLLAFEFAQSSPKSFIEIAAFLAYALSFKIDFNFQVNS